MYTRRVRSPEFVKKGEDSPYRASVNDDNWETDQKYWESMSNARGNALRQSQHQNTKSNKKQRTAGPEKTKIVIRKDEYFNPNDFSDPDHYMDQLDGPVDDDDLAEALERSRQTREYGAIVFRNRSLRSSSTAAHSGFSDDQQRVPFRSQFYANRYASASNDAVQATPVHTGGFIIGSVPLTPAMVSSGPAPPFSAAPQVPRQEHVFSYDYGQFATAPSQGSLRPKQTSVFAGANTPLQNRVVSHTYGQYTAPFLTAQAAAAMKLSLVQGYGSDSTARPVQQQQQLSLFSPPPPFVYQPQPGQQQYIMNPSAGIESPTRLGPGITYHDHTVAVMDDQTKTSVNRAGALMDTPTKPKVARNYFETPAGHQTGITAPPQTDNRTRVRPVRQPSNPPQEVEAQAAVGFPPRYLAFPARTGAPPTSFEYAPGAGIYPPAPPSMIVGPPSPRAASPSSMSVGSASATAVTSEAIFGSDDGTVAGGVAIGWNGTFCGIDLVEAGDESDSDQKEGGAAVGLNVQSRDIDLVGAGSDSESDKEHGGVPLDVSPYRTPEWKRLGYKKSEWEAAEKRRKGTETPTKEKKCGR